MRILRAIRFAARFDSNLDADIRFELSKGIDLSQISKERIRDEFLKGIRSAKSVVRFLNLLDHYSLFDWIFQGIDTNDSKLMKIESKNSLIVIGYLLLDCNVTKKDLNNLKYTEKEIKAILFFSEFCKSFEIENSISLKKLQKRNGISNDLLRNFISFMNMGVCIECEVFLDFEFSENAEQIMKKFNVSGKALGEKLKELETENFKNLCNLKNGKK